MDHTEKSRSPFEAAPLLSAVVSLASEKGVDYLCISVNPKHDSFYRRIGFTQVGTERRYGAVEAPAIGRLVYLPEWKNTPFVSAFLRSAS